MARMEIDDPDMYIRKKVDSSGKLYLGKEYAEEEIRVTVERLEDCEKSDDE